MTAIIVRGGIVWRRCDEYVDASSWYLTCQRSCVTALDAKLNVFDLFPQLAHASQLTVDSSFEEFKWIDSSALFVYSFHMRSHFQPRDWHRVSFGRISDDTGETRYKKITDTRRNSCT